MWEIGVFAGGSPLTLASPPGRRNPVLTARDVTDGPATFVADPFMIRQGDDWHLFFEVMRYSGRGEIGLASSRDGFNWAYRQIVLREECHLSYPCVLEWAGRHYLIPETLAAAEVRLYEAVAFPETWRRSRVLLSGQFADPTVFRHDGRWWMFVCDTPYRHDSLRLFGSPELEGPWVEHPASPIVVGDARFARPAGRVVAHGGKLLRFAQDCSTAYGSQVWAFEIGHLNAQEYEERPASDTPILQGGATGGWRTSRMHHLDGHAQADGSWLACVDGFASP